MARTLQSVDFDAVEMHMCFDQMQVLLRLMIMRLTVVVFTIILKFHAFFILFSAMQRMQFDMRESLLRYYCLTCVILCLCVFTLISNFIYCVGVTCMSYNSFVSLSHTFNFR